MAEVKEEVRLLIEQSINDGMAIAKTYIDNGDVAQGEALTAGLAGLQGQIDTLAGNTEALDKITNLLSKLKEDGDIADLLAGFSDLDGRLDQIRVDVNSAAATANGAKSVSDANQTYINGTVKPAITAVNKLSGDENTEGSLAKLQKQVDELGSGSITELDERIGSTEDSINGTVDADGNEVTPGLTKRLSAAELALNGDDSTVGLKGKVASIQTIVDGVDNAIATAKAQAQEYADGKFLDANGFAEMRNSCEVRTSIKNAVNGVFGFSNEECDDGGL